MKKKLFVFLIIGLGTKLAKAQLGFGATLDPSPYRMIGALKVKYETGNHFTFAFGSGLIGGINNKQSSQIYDTGFYYGYNTLPKDPMSKYKKVYNGGLSISVGKSVSIGSALVGINVEWQSFRYNEEISYLTEESLVYWLQNKRRKRIFYGNYIDSNVSTRVQSFSVNINNEFKLSSNWRLSLELGLIINRTESNVTIHNTGLIYDGTNSGATLLSLPSTDYRNYTVSRFIPITAPRISLTYMFGRKVR